ncbi:CD2 antigen cytoplasmic tail-binding protein 2 homolog [Sergentomyia squamirostris]
MSKRGFNDVDAAGASGKGKSPRISGLKKHTLDSDEEETDDEQYNILDENDIEGEEDGVAGMDGETKLTPFNMKEEMEEGHFDREGHYVWNKSKEITDNWLDNIDWVKIKEKKAGEGTSKIRTLGEDSSDSDQEEVDGVVKKFNEIASYKEIFELMKPRETVKKTLQRLGKSSKISSAERWRRKKAGIVDNSSEIVMKLTELANEILTRTGNMNIYEESYEFIEERIRKASAPAGLAATTSVDDSLDMYADDFDTKEKSKLDGGTAEAKDEEKPKEDDLMWEFKWKPEDEDLQGPYTTGQMHKWNKEGYFKTGVLVRKVGHTENFYTSNRIDFDIYL